MKSNMKRPGDQENETASQEAGNKTRRVDDPQSSPLDNQKPASSEEESEHIDSDEGTILSLDSSVNDQQTEETDELENEADESSEEESEYNDDEESEYNDSDEETTLSSDVSVNDQQNEESEYGDPTDDLFKQLETGRYFRGGIATLIKKGANLWDKRESNEVKGCYPIHIAAYKGRVQYVLQDMLKSFDDPAKRKRYMELRDGNGKNLSDILFMKGDEDPDDIKIILSYLKQNEQLEWLEVASKEFPEAFEASEDDVDCLGNVLDNMRQGHYIEVNAQRKREEALIDAGYSSGEESLGSIKEVEQGIEFVARVSYKGLMPTLNLIPSDWRMKTASKDKNQGDHVSAYILLLNTLSFCKGKNIKKLPEVLCATFCKALPDHENDFKEQTQKVLGVIKEQKLSRRTAVNLLKQFHSLDVDSKEINFNLKKAEIEEVARYVEKMADEFIKKINLLEGEAFSQSRKSNIARFVFEGMKSLANQAPELAGDRFLQFRKIVAEEIEGYIKEREDKRKPRGESVDQDEDKKKAKETKDVDIITNAALHTIVNRIATKVQDKKTSIPQQYLSLRGKSYLHQTELQKFLKKISPLKKYNEGHVVKEIPKLSKQLSQEAEVGKRAELLNKIGKHCAQLFDYPKVNKLDQDDVRVLYEAIPRHMIIIFAAFNGLRDLEFREKEIIYDSFLDQILKLQLWEGHEIENAEGEKKNLDKKILKTMISQYANIDASFDFSMKPSSQYPAKTDSERKSSEEKKKEREIAPEASASDVPSTSPKITEKPSSLRSSQSSRRK